jgi:IS5 family transposase
MAYRPNANQQISMYDTTSILTERTKKYLRNSWAEGFANVVFPAINEERFSVLYSDNDASRPNTPVNFIIGVLLIKEMFGETDEELMGSVLLNVGYQYALHSTSFEEQPMSDRTLSRFRERVYKHYMETGEDLIEEEMQSLAEAYGKYMKINPGMKRMDSAMVSANCRKLSRLSLMYRTVQMMVERLRKLGREEILDGGLLEYRKSAEHSDAGYKLKKEEITARMEEVLKDALRLVERCGLEYEGLEEYDKLIRMIEDQSKPSGETRVCKDGGEIKPTSMQNPSEPDATIRKKGGKWHTGYSANFVETCDEEHGNLITGYDLQPNVYSDMKFAKDVIGALPEENDTEVLIADGAYGSAQTMKAAEEKGVKLATTSLSGGIEDDFETKFEIEAGKKVVRCPAGYEPMDSKYEEKKGVYRAHFEKRQCGNCEYCKQHCTGVFQKKRVLIRVTDKAIMRAEYAGKLETEEYKKYARKRNGVEGVPSALRRRYGLDRMPVRGLARAKMWLGFKIGAFNTVRLLKAVSAPSFFAQIRHCFQRLHKISPCFFAHQNLTAKSAA